MPMCRGLELGFGVYGLGIRFWGLEIYEAGEEEERCGCAEACTSVGSFSSVDSRRRFSSSSPSSNDAASSVAFSRLNVAHRSLHST